MGRAFEYRRAAKEKRWDKMSKLFPKLSKAITLAAKEGGTDPEMNFKLRATIQNAKAENMPKDNIDSAIKRANNKEIKKFVEQVHEGKTGILSWLFFCKYFKDFQSTKKPLQLALAIKEHPCVLDHPTVRYQIIAWALQSKYPSKKDKRNLQEFALGLGD